MNRNILKLTSGIILIMFFCFTESARSQDWAKTLIKNQQRADFRDLGYPDVNEVPVNSSAITSLITASDGIIYGGTSGDDAYLLMFEPAINKVRHLGENPRTFRYSSFIGGG